MWCTTTLETSSKSILNMCHLLTGYIRGLEKVWIIGDNFCNHSFEKKYKKSGMNDESYAFQHFEVREYSSNRYDSLFSNAIGHIRNCFLKVVNEHAALPKSHCSCLR